MTPSKLRWGLLFIVVGIMLLLCNTGHLDWDFWYEILMWWPILLIAIGLEKIFLKTKLEFISYLSPLLLVAAMIYVAVDIGDFCTFSRCDKQRLTSNGTKCPGWTAVPALLLLASVR